jgi:hypothetical protein
MKLVAAVHPYAFKLELPDGRWTVEEKWLDRPPQVGAVVEFGGRWRVRSVERLGSRVGRERPLAVCRPA